MSPLDSDALGLCHFLSPIVLSSCSTFSESDCTSSPTLILTLDVFKLLRRSSFSRRRASRTRLSVNESGVALEFEVCSRNVEFGDAPLAGLARAFAKATREE